MTDTTCPEIVHSRDRAGVLWRCGKPIKRDGLCGTHAAAKERRLAKDKAMRERWSSSDEAKARVAASLAEWGIPGKPYYDWTTSRHTGEVVVDLETLRDLWTRAQTNG